MNATARKNSFHPTVHTRHETSKWKAPSRHTKIDGNCFLSKKPQKASKTWGKFLGTVTISTVFEPTAFWLLCFSKEITLGSGGTKCKFKNNNPFPSEKRMC